MSKSFMSAIRGVVNAVSEGAKDKTADGMTKDAAHFRHDLHKVQDSGFKHMVQKDSETSDYAKMFSGDVDKAPDRLSDQRAPEDLDKYVEYNEHLEIEEAKKDEKHEEDCECDDCSSDDNKVNEAAGVGLELAKMARKPINVGDSSKNIRTSAGPQSYVASRSTSAQPNVIQRSLNIGQTPSKVAPSGMSGSYDTTNQSGMGAATKAAEKMAAARPKSVVAPPVKTKAPGSETAAAASSSTNPANRNIKYTGPDTPKPKTASVSPVEREPATPPRSPMAGQGSSGATPPKPGSSSATQKAPEQKAPKAPALKKQQKQAPKKDVARPPVGSGSKDSIGGSGRPMAPRGGITIKQSAPRPRAKAAPGTNPLRSSFEIDIQGASYLVSESHAAAIAAFVEKYGMVDEGTAGEFINKEMKHPEKLTAKGKKQKIKQALAIYYSKKRRGENP
jgi:hypothetical protein